MKNSLPTTCTSTSIDKVFTQFPIQYNLALPSFCSSSSQISKHPMTQESNSYSKHKKKTPFPEYQDWEGS